MKNMNENRGLEKFRKITITKQLNDIIRHSVSSREEICSHDFKTSNQS